jgi:hypothetical protein
LDFKGNKEKWKVEKGRQKAVVEDIGHRYRTGA